MKPQTTRGIADGPLTAEELHKVAALRGARQRQHGATRGAARRRLAGAVAHEKRQHRLCARTHAATCIRACVDHCPLLGTVANGRRLERRGAALAIEMQRARRHDVDDGVARRTAQRRRVERGEARCADNKLVGVVLRQVTPRLGFSSCRRTQTCSSASVAL